MTTTKSSFSNSRFWPMFRSAFKAQIAFAIISGILMLIIIDVVFLTMAPGMYMELSQWNSFPGNSGASLWQYARTLFERGIYTSGAQPAVIMSVLALMMICSALTGLKYLHNKKTVDLYHALPVKRTVILGAHALASITAIIGPFVVLSLFTMGLQLVFFGKFGCFGLYYFSYILFDILRMIVYCAVIYAFVALVAVNVGTVFDTFAVTISVGFAPMIYYLISGAIWGDMTYGASFYPNELLTLCLSPFTFMYYTFFGMEPSYSSLSSSIGYAAYSMPTIDYVSVIITIAAGILVAAAFYVAAMLCYRRRKSETAEQTQPKGVLQTIVKLTAAFCGAALFFVIFYTSPFALRLVGVLCGAVIIGLIAELIMSRGIRAIKRNIIMLTGFGVVFCAILAGLEFDVIGYETRIPAANNISSVKINYTGRFSNYNSYNYNPYNYNSSGYYDYGDESQGTLMLPESIDIVREVHKMAVENRPPSYSYSNWDSWNANYDWSYSNSMTVEYTLRGGATLKRTYDSMYTQAYRKLADLEDKDDFIRNNSDVFNLDRLSKNKSRDVEFVEIYANVSDVYDMGRHHVMFDRPQELIEALKQDLLSQSLADIQSPRRAALGQITIQLKSRSSEDEVKEYGYYGSPSASVVVTSEFTNTLALLERRNLSYLLKPELETVSGIVFTPTWTSGYGSYSNSNTVQVFSSASGSYNYQTLAFYLAGLAGEEINTEEFPDYEYYMRDAAFLGGTVDKYLFKSVEAVTMTQFLPRETAEWQSKFVIAHFVFDSGSISSKVLKVESLPGDLRKQVEEELAKQYNFSFGPKDMPITPEYSEQPESNHEIV